MKKYNIYGILRLLQRVQGLPFVASGLEFEALIEGYLYGARDNKCTKCDVATYTAIWISEPTAESICTIGDMIYDRGKHMVLYKRLMGYVGVDGRYYCYD